MKSLYESILKTNNAGIPKNVKKVTPIKGERYFKGYSGNMIPNIDITSKDWYKVEFKSDIWEDDMIAYFCTDNSWVIWEAPSYASGYAAAEVSPATHKHANIMDFGIFDKMIREKAAIRGFIKIKTNLFK